MSRISVWVWFRDAPGGAIEQKIQRLAQKHSGDWYGQGTNLRTAERSNSFDFPGRDEAKSFIESVNPDILRSKILGGD